MQMAVLDHDSNCWLPKEAGLSNFERLKHGGLSWKLSSGVGRPDVLVAGSNTLGRTCACQKRLQIHGVGLPVCESAESRSARNAHLPAAALDDHDNPTLQPSLPSRLQQATGKHSRNAEWGSYHSSETTFSSRSRNRMASNELSPKSQSILM